MAKKVLKDSTTEEKILEAAKKVFMRDGMLGARMQDIADEAGINKALLHYYFRNKEQLFDVIFIAAATELFPRIKQIFESDAPLFDLIGKFCDEYITMIGRNPYLPLFVFTEINRDPAAFLKKVKGTSGFPEPGKFLGKIEKAVADGVIKKISPIHLLLNLLSMCIFPFVARPMVMAVVGLDDLQFQALLEQRKAEIPGFIIDSIKK